ncbi:MAG TPA: hypothetical protein VGY58_13805, partial [Gemmataceae bacterium]|nr:hypothetical protein [Gemmataceae bacterium]
HDAQELQSLHVNRAAESNSAPRGPAAGGGTPAEISAQLASPLPASAIGIEAEVARLRAAVSELQAKVANMAEELRALKEALGV